MPCGFHTATTPMLVNVQVFGVESKDGDHQSAILNFTRTLKTPSLLVVDGWVMHTNRSWGYCLLACATSCAPLRRAPLPIRCSCWQSTLVPPLFHPLAVCL